MRLLSHLLMPRTALSRRFPSHALTAIEEALGDTPVREPTLAPLARPGVTHRKAGTP